MFVGNSFHSGNYFESYIQNWHRNMYMLSWKMFVKIVNHKTRTQGCHTWCEQDHGFHISCESSNNEVGVMSSKKSEYSKWGRLKTHTHQNWKSVYAGQENESEAKSVWKCILHHIKLSKLTLSIPY